MARLPLLTQTLFRLARSAADAQEGVLDRVGDIAFQEPSPAGETPHPDPEAHRQPGRYAIVVEREDLGHDAEYRIVTAYRCDEDEGVLTPAVAHPDERALAAAIQAARRAHGLTQALPESRDRRAPRRL